MDRDRFRLAAKRHGAGRYLHGPRRLSQLAGGRCGCRHRDGCPAVPTSIAERIAAPGACSDLVEQHWRSMCVAHDCRRLAAFRYGDGSNRRPGSSRMLCGRRLHNPGWPASESRLILLGVRTCHSAGETSQNCRCCWLPSDHYSNWIVRVVSTFTGSPFTRYGSKRHQRTASIAERVSAFG